MQNSKLCRYCALKGVKHHSSNLEHKVEMETIGITLWFNNLTNTTSNVVKVDINSDNHEITPSVVVMRKTNQ